MGQYVINVNVNINFHFPSCSCPDSHSYKHAGQLAAGGVFDGCGMFGWCRIWFVSFNMFFWCTKRGLYIHNFIHIPSMICWNSSTNATPRCQRSWRSSLRSKEVTLKGNRAHCGMLRCFGTSNLFGTSQVILGKIGWILGKRQILDDHGWVA